MGTAERRERERLALQKKIIDAGRDILVNEGQAALTMRRLADEIEYTPGALYAHFADKDALVRAICEPDFLAFGARFATAQKIAEPVERLRELARVYARFALEHPAQYKVLFVLDALPNVKHDGVVERGNPEQDAYAVLELAVEEAIAAGHFRSLADRPQLVAQSLWAAMHGVVSIEIRRTEDMPIAFEAIDLRVETMCSVMMAGLDALEAPPQVKPRAKKQARARR